MKTNSGRLNKAFQQCFLDWTTEVCRVSHGQLVAIDGKTLRRSHDKILGKKAIHIISAWSSSDQVVMAQMKVDDKSNEIVAIPELLALLDLRGTVVSIDAIGCHKDIAEAILEKKADYLLGVKGSQAGLEQGARVGYSPVELNRFRHHPGISRMHRSLDRKRLRLAEESRVRDVLATMDGVDQHEEELALYRAWTDLFPWRGILSKAFDEGRLRGCGRLSFFCTAVQAKYRTRRSRRSKG
jgi:predicted transposase YbfD/YdcC